MSLPSPAWWPKLRASPLPPLAPLLVAALLIAPAPSEAQDGVRGAHEARFPEMHALLLETERVQFELIDRLASDLVGEASYFPRPTAFGRPMDPTLLFLEAGFPEVGAVERAVYRDFQDRLRLAAPARGGEEASAYEPAAGAIAPLRELIARTHALRRAVLDTYADPRITDRVFVVDELIEAYLNDPRGALPPVPKSMNLLQFHGQANTFGINFSFLQGMLWATHWVQYAAFEPLFLMDGMEERRAGLAMVGERFLDKLDVPPIGLPTRMPMAPTIAPGLRARHPEVAAILDNLNLLIGIAADRLLHAEVMDKEAAIASAVAYFTHPELEVVSGYDWTLMALRHGIFAQGGPALGFLDRSERNHAVIPQSRTQSLGSLLPGLR